MKQDQKIILTHGLLLFFSWFGKYLAKEELPLSFLKEHPLNRPLINASILPQNRSIYNIYDYDSRRYSNEFPGPVNWFSLEITSTVMYELFREHFSSHQSVDQRNVLTPMNFTTAIDHDYYSSHKEVFVYEFIADTGDSYQATYAMAAEIVGVRNRLEYLNNTHISGTALLQTLTKADALIFGGDLVYPQPSTLRMMNRLLHPFALAMEKRNGSLDVWAIPGNHDWLDGLKAFKEIFLMKGEEYFTGAPLHILQTDSKIRTGWKLAQTKPWFFIRLSKYWYMIGIDDQVGADMDLAQFGKIVELVKNLPTSSRFILVMHSPIWYQPQTSFGLRAQFFRFLWSTGRVRAVLSGDKHHFSYYRPSAGRDHPHLFVAGGGGAFLHPTHTLAEEITWEDMTSFAPSLAFSTKTFSLYTPMASVWHQEAVYPTKADSQAFAQLLSSSLVKLLATDLLKLYFGLHLATFFLPRPLLIMKLVILIIFGYPIWMASVTNKHELVCWVFTPISLCVLDFIVWNINSWIKRPLVWSVLSFVIVYLALWYGANYGDSTSDTLFAGMGKTEFKNMIRLVIDKETERLIVVPIGVDQIPALGDCCKAKLIGGPYVIERSSELDFENNQVDGKEKFYRNIEQAMKNYNTQKEIKKQDL